MGTLPELHEGSPNVAIATMLRTRKYACRVERNAAVGQWAFVAYRMVGGPLTPATVIIAPDATPAAAAPNLPLARFQRKPVASTTAATTIAMPADSPSVLPCTLASSTASTGMASTVGTASSKTF